MNFTRLALFIGAALMFIPVGASASAAEGPNCASAEATLEEGSLEAARDSYLELLNSEPTPACAAEGLRATTRITRQEKRLCAQGKALAGSGEAASARRHYAEALQLNTNSSCATSGLKAANPDTGAGKDEDEETWLEEASSAATSFLTLIGSAVLAGLIVLSLIPITVLAIRRRRPSLSVDPFVDTAVECKVGSPVAALVERSLNEISRRTPASGGALRLDLIATDIEVMGQSKSLETALGSLGETSQLKLLVALLALIDRMWGTHLAVKGELAPRGSSGNGLILGLQSEKDGLLAREILWKKSLVAAKNPTPYYDLVDPAASWVQFETARALEPRIEVITKRPRSFSALSEGVAEHRAGHLQVAADRYAAALVHDRENVAALFNLSVLLAREHHRLPQAISLLARASEILERRYQQLQ